MKIYDFVKFKRYKEKKKVEKAIKGVMSLSNHLRPDKKEAEDDN